MSAGGMYDCLIIGGGPAGLSAAVYMGRFLRKTLVLDAGEGRSSFEQVNDNYLGFPNGVKVRELRELGEQQARRFGVDFQSCKVERMERRPAGTFRAVTSDGAFEGRTVILCTGVCDIWPDFPGALEYVGKTLFWCITCDGFRAFGKRVVCIGRDDEAATTALQLLRYTRNVTFLTEPGKLDCTDEKVQDMERYGIRMVCGRVAEVQGSPEQMTAVILQGGQVVPADLIFSLLGCRPNNSLARDLGVECSGSGYVKVDDEGYTTVPGVFAAGDLSKMHTHQVVSAAHEGAEAAQTANYFLYPEFQKED